MKNKINFRRYIAVAMFAAIAYISLFVFRISGIGGFLTFDVKDAVITIASMLFGPVYGVIISLLISLIEMVSVSGTGPLGFLMNFVQSAVFTAVGSSIYYYMPRIRKKLSGAVIGLVGSVLLTTGVMMVMNLIITPIYQHVPVEVVKDMLLPLLLPFNLVKATLNAAVVLVLYKPLSQALKKAHVLPVGEDSDGKFRIGKTTILLWIIGAVLITAGVLVMVLVFGGHFEFIKK